MQFESDFKRSQATQTLMSSVIPMASSLNGVVCRACTVPLHGPDVRVRFVTQDFAHPECWFAPHDDGSIRERRRSGTSFSFYEWRCDRCGFDACSTKQPIDQEDRFCTRCRRDGGLILGSIVTLAAESVIWSASMTNTTRFELMRIRLRDNEKLGTYVCDYRTEYWIGTRALVRLIHEREIPMKSYATIRFLEHALKGHTANADLSDLHHG